MGTIEKVVTPKTGKTRYKVRYSFTDSSGTRVHRTRRFDKKKDAEAFLSQSEADLSRGVYFEPSRELFGSAMDRWLATLSCPPLSPSTLASYRRCASHRCGGIRNVPLADLTEAAVQRVVTGWQKEQLSGSTMQNGMKVIRGTIRMVMAERGLMVSPLVDVKVPAAKQAPMVTWTPGQVDQFLRSRRDDPWLFAWQLMFATGMRIGELCALRWSDIELEATLVRIERTWSTSAENKPVISATTKTAESRRVVPIPPHVATLLEQERAKRGDDGGWVCADGVNAATTRLVRHQFEVAVTESGVRPMITPHDARHTAATNMIAAGVPVAIVARVLGHRDPGFTMRRYVHPAANEMQAAVDVLGSLYRGETTLRSAQAASKVVPMVKKLPDIPQETEAGS